MDAEGPPGRRGWRPCRIAEGGVMCVCRCRLSTTGGTPSSPEEHDRFRARIPADRKRNRARRSRIEQMEPASPCSRVEEVEEGCSSVCSSAPVRERPPSSCLLPKRRVPAVVRFKQESTPTGSSSPTSRAARAGATCTERPLRARTATVPAHPGGFQGVWQTGRSGVCPLHRVRLGALWGKLYGASKPVI